MQFQVDEVKPMTNQRSSGRCWVFAALNAMRIPFMKEKSFRVMKTTPVSPPKRMTVQIAALGMTMGSEYIAAM